MSKVTGPERQRRLDSCGAPRRPQGGQQDHADEQQGRRDDDPRRQTNLLKRARDHRPEDDGLEIVGPLQYYGLIYAADEATLADLAYTFEYRYGDGRDPETYVAPLREAVDRWREHRISSLRYASRLVYEEGGRYLSLALPALLNERA